MPGWLNTFPIPNLEDASSFQAMTGATDEQTLILSAQQGDLEAFNLLIDRYQGLLFRVAFRMLGDEDAAADAAQTAWLAAYRKLNEQHGGRFSSWLMRILSNTCYDELRRRHRRGEVRLCPADDDGDERESANWLLDHSPSVEQQVDQREMEEALHSALQVVPPVYRSMIILVDIEGFGYEEAAAALHVPLGTVRSRVARGRIALRRQLELSGNLPREARQVAVQVAERTEARVP